MSTPLRDQLADLARRHRTSIEATVNAAYDPNIRGTSPAFVKKVLRGERRANRAMLEALAAELGEAPDVFTGYQLLSARALLDEDAVGYEEALRNLEKVRGPLGLDEGEEGTGAQTREDLDAKALDLAHGQRPPTKRRARQQPA